MRNAENVGTIWEKVSGSCLKEIAHNLIFHKNKFIGYNQTLGFKFLHESDTIGRTTLLVS